MKEIEELKEEIKAFKNLYPNMLKRAMEEAKKHIEPSPETRQKLSELAKADQEQNIILTKYGKDIDSMKTDIKDIKKDIKEGFKNLEDLINGCDNKYSSKWVEKAFTWVGTVVGGLILVSLISLIIKQ